MGRPEDFLATIRPEEADRSVQGTMGPNERPRPETNTFNCFGVFFLLASQSDEEIVKRYPYGTCFCTRAERLEA